MASNTIELTITVRWPVLLVALSVLGLRRLAYRLCMRIEHAH